MHDKYKAECYKNDKSHICRKGLANGNRLGEVLFAITMMEW